MRLAFGTNRSESDCKGGDDTFRRVKRLTQ